MEVDMIWVHLKRSRSGNHAKFYELPKNGYSFNSLRSAGPAAEVIVVDSRELSLQG